MGRFWLTMALRIGAVVVLLAAGNLISHWASEFLDFDLRPSNEDAVHRMLMLTAAIYTILLAIPFVPATEIGMGILAVMGPRIGFLVYLCTVSGLCLSYFIGWCTPASSLIRLAQMLRLRRIEDFIRRIEPLSERERLEFLAERAPHNALPVLLNHRYLALAIIFNVPGNIVIGGGGGIALFAGLSRLFSPVATVSTIVLAVAPVPVLYLLFMG